MYLKYARSVLNIRIYRKFAQTDDKHIVSAETLKLVTEAELRKIKLNAYDAELSRKIDEVLFEKSKNEMIVPQEEDMNEYMKRKDKEEEEEEDFVQSTIRADPTLWSALAATTSSTATMPRATEFDIQRLENQCTTLSVECSEMRKRVTDTLNRILRGSRESVTSIRTRNISQNYSHDTHDCCECTSGSQTNSTHTKFDGKFTNS